MRRPLLILLAKAPRAGRVKTRLCPPLSPAEAASLHSALVRDAAALLLSLTVCADVELSTDVATGAWTDFPMRRSIQCEGDLGARMFHALKRGLAAGHEKVMLVGSDSPGLPAAHLVALLQSQADVALGPTTDGGYFAIACRAIASGMFQGVRWSAEHTLADTAAAVSARGLTVETGPGWFDVDVETDLQLMLRMSSAPENTKAWMEQYRRVQKASRMPA